MSIGIHDSPTTFTTATLLGKKYAIQMNPFSKVRQYPCLNEIYLNRSVSIYHAFLSLIVNNHAENVVRASCNARVKIRVSFVTSTRTVSNERKKEEGGEEKGGGGETLTTTRPRSWLEWHFRESALPVEFYFFPPLSLFFPPVFSMLPYFVQEVSKGQATPIVT